MQSLSGMRFCGQHMFHCRNDFILVIQCCPSLRVAFPLQERSSGHCQMLTTSPLLIQMKDPGSDFTTSLVTTPRWVGLSPCCTGMHGMDIWSMTHCIQFDACGGWCANGKASSLHACNSFLKYAIYLMPASWYAACTCLL